ncbi:SH3 domain-containing protein [uncultured Nostoc sp.]|uniref:SH3 domain-containing protein n=1 Tax=uncultured Nostoc sp. TaxID=340711 RepID=UPI00260259CF|nr:SH3 domain-containing protein [uncultured Nostoc sp.]
MLSTKENLKQIEMDTIQQEPLFTELTPEAAATVEGGAIFTYTTKNIDPGSSLNIRPTPSTKLRPIGSIQRGETFKASSSVTKGFRKLFGRAGWVAAKFTQRVLNTSAGRIILT